MIKIVGVEETGKLPEAWGDYDFSKESLAMVAFGEAGGMCLLWTCGGHVRMEIEEAGLSIEDVLPEPNCEGVWVWVGHSEWREGPYEYPNDGETEQVGNYRAPTDAEWASLKEGRCPWDDEEWKLKGKGDG